MQGIKLNNKILLDKDGNIIVVQKSFTNINNGEGDGSVQQLHALAVGEDSSALGLDNISIENGEYNMSVSFEVTHDDIVKPLANLPTSTYTPSSGESTPATAYLDETEFLNLTNILYKTTGAFGFCAHSEGKHTLALGDHSHSEGALTYASKAEAHAEGYKTIADGNCSHAEGMANIVRGQASHVEGMSNVVLSKASHAEGFNNYVDGIHSHAEGVSNIIRSGSSHASGYYNAILHGANASLVCGAHNKINEEHNNSFVTGQYNQTSAPVQTVVGIYNADNPDALFIVGNGTSTEEDDRGNALEVLKDGTVSAEKMQGNLYGNVYGNVYGGVQKQIPEYLDNNSQYVTIGGSSDRIVTYQVCYEGESLHKKLQSKNIFYNPYNNECLKNPPVLCENVVTGANNAFEDVGGSILMPNIYKETIMGAGGVAFFTKRIVPRTGSCIKKITLGGEVFIYQNSTSSAAELIINIGVYHMYGYNSLGIIASVGRNNGENWEYNTHSIQRTPGAGTAIVLPNALTIEVGIDSSYSLAGSVGVDLGFNVYDM